MENFPVTRMTPSGSPVGPRSVTYRDRGTALWSLGGRRAVIGVPIDGTRMPAAGTLTPSTNPYVHTPKLTGNVIVVDGGAPSGIRTTGTPPA